MLIYGPIFQKESMQFSGIPNDEYDGMPALKELMHA